MNSIQNMQQYAFVKGTPLKNSLSTESKQDAALFSKEMQALNMQQSEGKQQLEEKPAIVDEIIYDYVNEDEAASILAFLDGKNYTKIRYQHLLETDPEKADIFIKSLMEENGCYGETEKNLDKQSGNMSYEEFLDGVNNSLVDYVDMRIQGDSLWRYTFFDGVADQLMRDNQYGSVHHGIRDTNGYEKEFLSPHSDKWLSLDALIDEQYELGLRQSPVSSEYKTLDYLEEILSYSPKPIGYGNQDKYIYGLGYQKNTDKFVSSESFMELYNLINS